VAASDGPIERENLVASIWFRYGGAAGIRQRLVEASDCVVVRTRARGALADTPLGALARRLIRGWSSVLRFEDAGVEILRAPRGARRTAARRALKEEHEIEFAGRVLRRPRSSRPVIYTENLFVKFRDGLSEDACRSILDHERLTPKEEPDYASNAYFVGAPPNCGRRVFEISDRLLAKTGVELCHPELVTARRERAAAPQQWHLHAARLAGNDIEAHANVVAAWELTRGEGTTIAVIDDGVDVDHEEFAGEGKIVAPRDVTRSGDNPRPQFSSERHGTACAGVACGNGEHGASGVAPDARLMPIRIRAALGSQREAEAISWAARNHADVISCSWGPEDGDLLDPDDPDHDMETLLPDHTRLAIEFATREGRGGKGCVITWAAGNGNESMDRDHYASNPNVIAVGASDDLNRRAPYSDHGKALWCLFPSDHHFPSVTKGIWTTDRTGGSGYNHGRRQLGDSDGNYTNSFGGTSSACPGAAGVAALVLARNRGLRWTEVKQILADSCEKIAPDEAQYDADGWNSHYGFGRLDALRAVQLARAARARRTALLQATEDIAVAPAGSASLSLPVAEAAPIGGLRVAVAVDCADRGDLTVRLAPPAALAIPPILLHEGEGGSPDLTARYTTSTTAALAQLQGHSPAGEWRLEVGTAASAATITRFGIELDL
jgi:subtilisin family serine protease